MIECVCYIADDGTAFEDEDECIDYERGLMLKKYEHDIHMWDDNFQPIPITDPQPLDKVYYLTCDTAEAAAAPKALLSVSTMLNLHYANGGLG